MSNFQLILGLFISSAFITSCNAEDPFDQKQRRTAASNLSSADSATSAAGPKERSIDACKTWLTAKYQEYLVRLPSDMDIFVHCAKVLDLHKPITYAVLEKELKDSPEAQTAGIIKRAYQDLLGRLPDSGGRDAAYAALTSGRATEASLRESIVYSREYCEAWMTGKYQDYFKRAPNAKDFDFHCGRIVAREISYDAFDQELRNSPEFKPRN